MDDWTAAPIRWHTTAGLLLAWATRLCRLDSPDPAAVKQALSIGDEPPDGFARLVVGEDRGGFSLVEGEFARPSLTRAALDETFGPGNDVPRVHFDSPRVVAYRVEVAEAPYYVDVFARFADPSGPAVGITLRRSAVSPPRT